MVSYYRSRVVYPNRKQEARRRAFGFAFLVSGIFVLIGLLGWGFYSFIKLEKFRIKHIAVEGTRALSQDEIRVYAGRVLEGSFLFIIPKNHYVFASSRRVADALQKEFPRIRSASIGKSFPDSMKIFVEERTEWGVFCRPITNNQQPITNNEIRGVATNTILVTDGGGNQRICGYIDRDGMLFEYPLEIFGALLPVISDDSPAESREGDAVVSRDVVSFFDEAHDKTQRELGVALSGLEISKDLPDDYRLRTREGWYAFVPRTGDSNLWMNSIKILLERELQNRAGLEYIDARFGNRIFYKKR